MNRDLILTQPAQLPQFQAALKSRYQAEEERCRLQLMEGIALRSTKLTLTASNALRRAHAKVEAIEQGFFPVPRFETTPLNQMWRTGQDDLPDDVFDRFAEAITANIFEQIALVIPSQAKRDPLLVGIIGKGTNEEEHYLIAWWS